MSAVGHIGLLLAVLFFAGAGGVRFVPPETIAVELVPADEAPSNESEHVEGTPLDSTSHGSEVSSDSKEGSASGAPPRPRMTVPPSPQQAQSQPDAGSPANAQPQTAPPADGETPPLPSQALVIPAPAAQPQPQPRPNEAQSEPKASDMFAMPLALPGGRLGGGFDAPASNPAMLPHDDTAAFRARLSACSRSAGMFGMDDHTAIQLRVSFKRDGTLAAPPEVRSSLSADAVALTKMAINALERCQPFTELPADKYKTWKTLDLVVTPLSFSAE